MLGGRLGLARARAVVVKSRDGRQVLAKLAPEHESTRLQMVRELIDQCFRAPSLFDEAAVRVFQKLAWFRIYRVWGLGLAN